MNQWYPGYKPMGATATALLMFNRLQLTDSQDGDADRMRMLFLTASSAEAAAAPVSTLNPTQYRNLQLSHSAACQAKAGNCIEPSSNKPTTLSHRHICLRLLQLDPLKHTQFTSSTIFSHQEKLSLILQFLTTVTCRYGIIHIKQL